MGENEEPAIKKGSLPTACNGVPSSVDHSIAPTQTGMLYYIMNETRIATNINEFLEQGIEARILADKHFPNDGPERSLLLGIESTFRILWDLHYSLERTRDQIERVRHLALPGEREIIELALTLKNTAANCQPGSESQKAFQLAGEHLHIWYDLCLNLEKLLEASEPLRFGIGRQKGVS